MHTYLSGQLAHDRRARLQAKAAHSRLAAAARGARRQESNAARTVLTVEAVGGVASRSPTVQTPPRAE
jgi:hypothetical protein